MEALEAEKVDLGEQIGELLGESRSLLKMKMSLSLEVATYRYLRSYGGNPLPPPFCNVHIHMPVTHKILCVTGITNIINQLERDLNNLFLIGYSTLPEKGLNKTRAW